METSSALLIRRYTEKCVTNPFSLHHVGLPSCCPCQGTVGNDATVDSSEPGPFGQRVPCGQGGQPGLRLPKFRSPAPPLPGCVTLDRLLVSLCFRFPVCRMGITLYGPLRDISEALQIELSTVPDTEYLPKKRVLSFPIPRPPHCYRSPASPPPPSPRFIHTTGPELPVEWVWGGGDGLSWAWHCLPPPQQLRTVLHQCSSESPGK